MQELCGVLLCGGTGSRMGLAGKVTNKHLLPVYDRPMLCHGLDMFVAAGVHDVLVVVGDKSAGDVLAFVGDGAEFGLRCRFAFQRGATGIAGALALAREFAWPKSLMVVLGDNVVEDATEVGAIADRFRAQEKGARIVLKDVDDPRRFGVAVLDSDGHVIHITEKPAVPQSRYAVVGIYFYPRLVFDLVACLKPSARGELEISDVNSAFCATTGGAGLEADILLGWWSDAGTPDSLLHASTLVAEQRKSK